MVTVSVENVEEDPTLTFNRLQVRAGLEDATTVTANLTDPDGATGIAYTWFVPKVSRPDLENEDHWILAPGAIPVATDR